MKTKAEVQAKGGVAALHIVCEGQGDPLLLIHGAGVDSEFFSRTAEYLSRRFFVVRYDRRGAGRSLAPLDGDYSIAAQVEDTLEVIRSIGRPCLIAAHSAGSAVAMELACVHPELVQRLLLFEPTVASLLPAEGAVARELRHISELTGQKEYVRAANRFLLLMGPQSEHAHESSAEEIRQAGRNFDRFIRHEFNHFFDYRPDLTRLGCTHTVIGLSDYNDRTALGEMAHKLSEALHCKLLRFPGRHNCPADLPEEFAYMAAGMALLCTEDNDKGGNN